MIPKPPECRNCALYAKDPNGFVRPEGTGSLGVLAFGESGGEREYREGLPFRPGADAGSVLERAFKRLGYDRQQWALANIVNCRPNSSAPNPAARNWLEGAPWELDAINSCRVHRDRIVAKYRPKCIVALGGIALRVLTGMAGWKQGITDLRGYVLPALDYKDEKGRPVPVIGATHPAYLRRASGPGGAGASTAELGVLYQDLRKAVEVARTGWDFEAYKPNYGKGDWTKVSEGLPYMDSSLVIAYDIETNVSADIAEDELLAGAPGEDIIQSIQFSTAKEYGEIWPWREPFIGLAKEMLALSHRKIGFNNWCFDDKVLAAAGVRIEGKSDDLMWAFHSLQPDLPMGLQSVVSHFGFPFPWKHWSRMGGRDKQRYGCADVDVLHWIDEKIWGYLEARKVTRSYVRHKREFDPILREAEVRGVPLNARRRKDLDQELSEQKVEVLAKIREEVPLELQKVHPPQGYKKEPKEVTKVRETANQVLMEVPGMLEVQPEDRSCMELNQKDLEKKYPRPLVNGGLGPVTAGSELVALMPLAEHRNPTTGEMEKVKWDYRKFVVSSIRVVDVFTTYREPFSQSATRDETIWRWCKVLPFKPTAWQQVLAYIKHQTEKERREISNPRRRKWTVPKTIRGDRETTERRELERLIAKTRDPVLKGTVKHRELVKMHSTYVVGWEPGPDGRVHTTFGYNTGSGQLTSKRPNVQNCFSPDTEILTDIGWRTFDNLPDRLRVAQYNERTSEVSFIRPSLIAQSFDGDMCHVTSKLYIDLMVTPDHECLLRRRTEKFCKVLGSQYPQDCKQLSAGFYGGVVRERWSEVVLTCAMQADGHIHWSKRQTNPSIEFTFRKMRKMVRLRAALTARGISFRESLRKDGRFSIYIGTRSAPAWMIERKVFGEWLLDWDAQALDQFTHEVMLWDGCATRMNHYSSSDRKNADWVQTIFILRGHRARLRSYDNGNPKARLNWQVDVKWGHDYSWTTNRRIERVPYKGKVYCVTVPFGNIVVRRGGVVAITGNCPKHREIAKSWRRMVEARPGYVLVEMDFKGLHSVTTGFEARDLEYIRISKIDIHSFLLSHYLKREGLKPVDPRQPDDALADELKWVRKKFTHERNYKAKRVVHGRQFGLRARGCYKRYEDDFENEAEVKRMFAVMAELFSRHAAWMGEITQKAHEQTFLLSLHGYIRWLYCVFDWNSKRGDWGPGADHEAAIAYLPANDGHGHLRDAVLRLRENGLDGWIINLIHDSVMMEMPDDARLPERISKMHEVMSGPSEVLIDQEIAPGGLQVGVDVEVGRNWGKFGGRNPGGMRDWNVQGGGYGQYST